MFHFLLFYIYKTKTRSGRVLTGFHFLQSIAPPPPSCTKVPLETSAPPSPKVYGGRGIMEGTVKLCTLPPPSGLQLLLLFYIPLTSYTDNPPSALFFLLPCEPFRRIYCLKSPPPSFHLFLSRRYCCCQPDLSAIVVACFCFRYSFLCMFFFTCVYNTLFFTVRTIISTALLLFDQIVKEQRPAALKKPVPLKAVRWRNIFINEMVAVPFVLGATKAWQNCERYVMIDRRSGI